MVVIGSCLHILRDSVFFLFPSSSFIIPNYNSLTHWTMPKLDISVEEEQKQLEADVTAIEKQWSSPRQAHLKR